MIKEQTDFIESLKEFISQDRKLLQKDIKSLENTFAIKFEVMSNRMESLEQKVEEKVATQDFVRSEISLIKKDVDQNKKELEHMVTLDLLERKISDLIVIKWVLTTVTGVVIAGIANSILKLIKIG